MHIAVVVLSILLGLAFLASGAQKLLGVKQSTQIRDQLSVPARLWQAIGVLEVAGGLGVLIGLVVPLLGVVAAAALGLLMLGGIITHARAHDLKHAPPAVVMLLLSIALVVVATV